MLLNARVPWKAFNPVAGYLHTNGLVRNSNFAYRRDNCLAFGKLVSMPQGFTDASRAIYPSISKTDFIRAALIGAGVVGATAGGLGVLEVTVTGVGTLTADSEMGATLGATVTGVGSMSGKIAGVGSMGVIIDAGSRPSAFDIAQEVWQSQKTSYNAPGTMGNALNNASSGGVDMDALAQAVWEYVDRTLTAGGGSATPEDIAAAILLAAQTTPISANIKEVNDLPVDGAGTESDPWGPV